MSGWTKVEADGKWYRVPVAYGEEEIEAPFYKPNQWDFLVKVPGFFRDFMYTYRGVRTQSSFALWGAAFAVSSVLKRQSWLDFSPLPPIYPNLYLVFVGPPASGKSTVIRAVERLLHDYHYVIGDANEQALKVQEIKRTQLLRSKATPEALMMTLSRWKRSYLDLHGHEVDVDEPQAEAILIVSELDTFLGKQTYNSGLISKLTDWYDCKEYDSDDTVKRGGVVLRNIFLSLLGGTTPDKLDKTFPEEILGGGFMSRTILVNEGSCPISFAKPKVVPGAPDEEELKKRLAWISVRKWGEFTMSEKAEVEYERWYNLHYSQLLDMEGSPEMHLHERMDQHLLRLAILFRAQRYSIGTEISVEDVIGAERVLDATYRTAYSAIEDVGAGPYQKWYNRARYLLQKAKKEKKSLTRRQMLRQMSPYQCNSENVTRIIQHLFDEGYIDMQRDGNRIDHATNAGREVYTWVGPLKDEKG